MRNKSENGGKNGTGNSLTAKKGDETRQMILAAARQVFAVHPYNAASIRMIAAQGDFYHGLIRYHFPSKAGIFEAVVDVSCRTIYRENKDWLREISSFAPDKALSTYLDRFIEFFKNQPEVFRIIVKNLSHEDPSTLPGYGHLKALLIDTRRDFEAVFPGLFESDDVNRFLSSLNALILHFLGGGEMEAEIMNLAAKSEAYLQWVKETLYFVFCPVLEKSARDR